MARKARKSSCQVEHWWEARGTTREGQGKWQRCSSNDLQFITRHMLEIHHFGKTPQAVDLTKPTWRDLDRLGIVELIRARFVSRQAAFRHAYPEFFDWSRPDHLHEWDFLQKRMWIDDRSDGLSREAIRHMLEVHHLGRPATPQDLLVVGNMKGLRTLGFEGLLSSKFRGSPLAALRHAYPEFFDWSRPDHLHEWNFFQNDVWQGTRGDNLSRTAIRHIVEVHHLGRSATPQDLRELAREVLCQHGLGGMLVQKFRGCRAVALRHAYPELFDWSRPDHLHEWDFPQNRMWRNEQADNLARTAVRHTLEVHHFGRPVIVDDLRHIDTDLLKELDFAGMLQNKFSGSPLAALRHAYPEFAEAIGRRIHGAGDFMGMLESENPERARKLIRDLMQYFGDDLVDVADILAVVYTGRLEAKTAMEILQDPTMRPWIVPFTGKGHGPGKPPIGDDFPFYLLEKDGNGVIAGIIRRRLTEWRRKVLGARPNQETRAKFLRELRELQDKFRANGGKGVALAAE